MKATESFGDQLALVSAWFSLWNQCEQVVALYTLLRKISPAQTRFIGQVVSNIVLSSCGSGADIEQQEQQANDPAYISSLIQESKDVAVTQLLRCLPLLTVNNMAAKAEYLNIMPKVLSHSVENQCHLEECRQLLSYALIHPAITSSESSQLTVWLVGIGEAHAHASSAAQSQTGNVLQFNGYADDGGYLLPNSLDDLISPSDVADGYRCAVPRGSGSYVGAPEHGSLSARSSLNDWTMRTRDSGIDESSERCYSGFLGLTSGGLAGMKGGCGVGRPLTASASLLLTDISGGGGSGGGGHSLLSWTGSEPRNITGLGRGSGGLGGMGLGGDGGAGGSGFSHSVNFSNPPQSQSTMPSHQKLIRSPAINPLALPGPPSLAAVNSVSDWLNRQHQGTGGGGTIDHSPSRGGPPPGLGGLAGGGGVAPQKLAHLTVEAQGEHVPLSPQSSLTSSGSGGSVDGGGGGGGGGGSESRHHRRRGSLVGTDDDTSMKDVQAWLKALRLHKYSALFHDINYEQMLRLNDQWLESRGVTKGARNKIVISIQKLNSRQDVLRKLEKEVLSGNVKPAMTEIRQMLNTPIKYYTPHISPTPPTHSTDPSTPAVESSDTPTTATDTSQISVPTQEPGTRDTTGAILGDDYLPKAPSCSTGSGSGGVKGGAGSSSPGGEGPDSIADGDLPGQLTRLLGKICTQLLVTMRPEPECLASYVHLLDRCTSLQVFSSEQKKKMFSWKDQIQRVCNYSMSQQQKHGQQGSNASNLDYRQNRFRFSVSGVSPPGPSLPPSSQHRALRGAGAQLSTPGQPTWTFGDRPVVNASGQQEQVQTTARYRPSGLSPTGGRAGGGGGGVGGGEDGVGGHAPLQPVFMPRLSALRQPVSRTQSAPMRSAALAAQQQEQQLLGLSLLQQQQQLQQQQDGAGALTSSRGELSSSTSDEIHASLDSLCISMMEHALGPYNDSI